MLVPWVYFENLWWVSGCLEASSWCANFFYFLAGRHDFWVFVFGLNTPFDLDTSLLHAESTEESSWLLFLLILILS